MATSGSGQSPGGGGSSAVKERRNGPRLYEGDADLLLAGSAMADRVSLLPGIASATGGEWPERIRVLWGQHMLRDVLDGRYRTVICGVNDADNSHGIISQFVSLVPTSQWTPEAVTSYAKLFQESVAIHASNDREPYVLKYDLDMVLVLAILRPRGRDHFTLSDIRHGMATASKMVRGRPERRPVASVSFLGARSNRLVDGSGSGSGSGAGSGAGSGGGEPSFEAVLRTMFEAGFRGDVYPSTQMWGLGQVGVFPSYPWPAGVDRMREGSS